METPANSGKQTLPASSKGSEHRRHRRYQISMPVEVVMPDEPAIQTTSRNISARGVYFTLDRSVPLASDLEFSMTLPPQMCQGRNIRVHCHGRVARREALDSGDRIGVAAEIDQYEFIPVE